MCRIACFLLSPGLPGGSPLVDAVPRVPAQAAGAARRGARGHGRQQLPGLGHRLRRPRLEKMRRWLLLSSDLVVAKGRRALSRGHKIGDSVLPW